MKFLLLIGVLVLAWVLFFKGRRKPPPPVARPDAPPAVAAMLACAGAACICPRQRPCSTRSAGPTAARRIAWPGRADVLDRADESV